MLTFALRCVRFSGVFLILLGLASFLTVGAQDTSDKADEKPKPELVDEFGRVGDCDFSGRMDAFMAELSKRPDHQGYIINYLGVDALPSEREKYVRERLITNHINFRNFDRSRITLLRGGFREEIATELWLIPPGADFPTPSRTLPEPKIPANRTFLFGRNDFITNDFENPLDDFVLESVKTREEAERLAEEEELKSEQAASGEGSEVEPTEQNAKPEPQVEGELSSDEEDGKTEEDLRTPEEKEADRFKWADGLAWLYLDQHPKHSGVIIFYADNQYYDIHRLQSFVTEGKNRMADLAKMKPSRVRVVFGGYRQTPEIEFWIVPPKGKQPVPAPDERPVDEAVTNKN